MWWVEVSDAKFAHKILSLGHKNNHPFSLGSYFEVSQSKGASISGWFFPRKCILIKSVCLIDLNKVFKFPT